MARLSGVMTGLVIMLLAPACLQPNEGSSEQHTLVPIDCTRTQGYWKNHEEAWPVSSLMLGSVTYSKAQLLTILRTPIRGNGLISLAHQLIAAKLNDASGAETDPAIAAADALIGGLVIGGGGYLHPSATSGLVDDLSEFNESSSDNCEPNGPVCGDGYEDPGEECDDGNTYDGDGCSSTCEKEHVPCCGDGYIDPGEQCDDGNTYDGDGCSSTCQYEAVCGDCTVGPGEQCDDGNTTSYDGCSSTCQHENDPQ